MAKEVEEVKTGTVTTPTVYDKFVAYINERADVETSQSGAEDLTASQVEKIFSAEELDDLWAAMTTAGLTGLRDVENGTVIRIHGFRLVRGQLGIGVWAVLDADNPSTGESMALDTGVIRVIAFLRRIEVMEQFPITVKVVKKTTGSGNEMITLAKP